MVARQCQGEWQARERAGDLDGALQEVPHGEQREKLAVERGQKGAPRPRSGPLPERDGERHLAAPPKELPQVEWEPVRNVGRLLLLPGEGG